METIKITVTYYKANSNTGMKWSAELSHETRLHYGKGHNKDIYSDLLLGNPGISDFIL